MLGEYRDGDLPPGVYKRMADGTLVPATEVFTSDPPRPINIDAQGKITDVTRQDVDYLNEVVLEHYEGKARHSLTSSPEKLQKFKDFVNKAIDVVLEDQK